MYQWRGHSCPRFIVVHRGFFIKPESGGPVGGKVENGFPLSGVLKNLTNGQHLKMSPPRKRGPTGMGVKKNGFPRSNLLKNPSLTFRTRGQECPRH